VGEVVGFVTTHLPSIDLNTNIVLVKNQLERVFFAEIASATILVLELNIILPVVPFATGTIATAIVARRIDGAPALPIFVFATVHVEPATGTILVSTAPPHAVNVADTIAIFVVVTGLREKLRSQRGRSIERRLTPAEIGTYLLGLGAFTVSSSAALLSRCRYHCPI